MEEMIKGQRLTDQKKTIVKYKTKQMTLTEGVFHHVIQSKTLFCLCSCYFVRKIRQSKATIVQQYNKYKKEKKRPHTKLITFLCVIFVREDQEDHTTGFRFYFDLLFRPFLSAPCDQPFCVLH